MSLAPPFPPAVISQHNFYTVGVIMKKKYRALRIISWVYRILAILVLIGAVVGAVLSVVGPTALGVPPTPENTALVSNLSLGPIGAVISLVSGIFVALGLYAFGQLFQLLIDLEENTRGTTLLLQRMLKSRE
jgi:ABC-type multidrug transport system fused ATPase/permease subunit